jgi:hypothetical protein
MIDVVWDGRPMLMFVRDLLDRGEELLDNDQHDKSRHMSA